MRATIFDIKKYAIHDGPGIRTTIFFKGCPLRCAWCHNPESWELHPEPAFRSGRCGQCGRCAEICSAGAIRFNGGYPETDPALCSRCGACIPDCPGQAREIVGYSVSVDEIMAEIVKDIIFYDESGGGVTVSGGEPLMQPEFVMELLARCRERDIHSAIDTSGFAESSAVEEAASLANLFLYDLKHMDSQKHKQFTGVDNSRILDNLILLEKRNTPVIIRIPVIPGFNDTAEEMSDMADFLKSFRMIQRIEMLPYHSGGVSKAQRLGKDRRILSLRRPGDRICSELAERFQPCKFPVTTGG